MTTRPGRWPVPQPVDLDQIDAPDHEARDQMLADRARFHLTLGSIRADLEDQPSPAAVRAAGRRWIDAVTHLTDEVAAQHKKAG